MLFRIENRRYVGSKSKLCEWIDEKLNSECQMCSSFFDVFAGTGVVTQSLLNSYSSFYINDFLFSNEIIYKGFFLDLPYSEQVLNGIRNYYNSLDATKLVDNYVSLNYGDKYFSYNDAKIIGFIREDIENKKNNGKVNDKEYYILISSLIYSLDRAANTVGHYEAYIKGKSIRSSFCFELIQPYDVKGKTIGIYRKDANLLAKTISCDIAFLDPPYNSRQYSRFYHVLETIVKWDKPELYGVAMKPKEENMSIYCRGGAAAAFDELVHSLQAKYIVVTYNNTYKSKSTSSQNKITLEQIEQSLNKRGSTKVFDKPYRFFNAGKTEFDDHKEYLFITRVEE